MVENYGEKTTAPAKTRTLQKDAEIKQLMLDLKGDLTVKEFVSRAECLIGNYYNDLEGIKLKLFIKIIIK